MTKDPSSTREPNATREPSRRQFLKGLAAIAGAAANPSIALGGSDPGTRPPNVVLIVADDLGRECLDLYGGTSYATPAISSLASAGMRFTHCYATPWCFPTRLQMLTGKYAFRNYRGWGVFDPDAEATFGTVMRNTGYATCVSGKWHMCRFDDPANADHPTRSGFDEHCLWFGEEMKENGNPKASAKYWAPLLFKNGTRLQARENEYGPDIFCNYILDFISRNRTRPFLAYFPMALPHAPWEPTPDSGPLVQGISYMPKRVIARFAGLFFADYMACIDRSVGRIVAGLEELGLREQTLLIFTSDNGTAQVIRSEVDGRTVNGGKRRLTDLGIRLPMVASWPGHVPAGSVCEELVDLSDVLPTFGELAGAELPEDEAIDGKSFLPLLLGGKQGRREWIYSLTPPETDSKRVVRTRDWKLDGDGNLFDMRGDPWDEHPVSREGQTPEAARARAHLQSLLASLGQAPSVV